MSSKRKKNADPHEFYPTDRKVVYALLGDNRISLPGGTWIEPCAGTGRIIAATNEKRSDIDRWIACEIQEGFRPELSKHLRSRDEMLFGDFVHQDWTHGKADVLIMNPPFSLTKQFVICGMQRARWVVCLQRQGWFGTKDRSSWLANYCPDFFQLPWRPSFRPDGNTDSCEYCWFIWPPGSEVGRREGRIAMLDMPSNGQLMLI